MCVDLCKNMAQSVEDKEGACFKHNVDMLPPTLQCECTTEAALTGHDCINISHETSKMYAS